jgi:methyltransferase-like protein/SAM-dependent methyltransferase
MNTGRDAIPPATSYDDFPYESNPYPQTHPDRLATVASLFGMKPAPIDRCRVLELGCAGGGNLIPMAVALPDSRFVGIDLSGRQVDGGQKLIAALKLQNIDLRHLSILDVNPDAGLFDYIICHGVFSWVPNAVQDKILDICARNLAPQGVAFISYNTYPGWHMSGTIRDMLCYHARRFAQPQERVKQARALLSFLVAAVGKEDNAYSGLLKEGLEVFAKVNDSYLLHEYLEEVNDPLYFHQFNERLTPQGLQYLAESEVHTMVATRFGPDIASAVEKVSSDCIELEQFMDFLRNRKFRQTLICHREIALQRKIGYERLAELFVASALRPVAANPDIHSSNAEQFRSPRGRMSSTTGPLLKAALVQLADHWPEAISFTALTQAARTSLGSPAPANPADDAQNLGNSILQLYSANLVQLHVRKLAFVREVAERPIACPLARHQAAIGSTATNRRHELLALGNLERTLLPLLDGTRDRPALVDLLAAAQPNSTRQSLDAAAAQSLVGLANRAMLVS